MTTDERKELARLKTIADAAYLEWHRHMRMHSEMRDAYDKAQAAYIKFKNRIEAQ